MQRLFLFLALVPFSLFAYSDVIYTGFYGFGSTQGSVQDDSLPLYTPYDQKFSGYGIRFGGESNLGRRHLWKTRYEVALEQRDVVYTTGWGSETEGAEQHLKLSYYIGRNLDLFLTDELTLFFKAGFNYSRGDETENGSNFALGLSMVYAFRWGELQFGIDKEYQDWDGTKIIPIRNMEESDGDAVIPYGGFNIRF